MKQIVIIGAGGLGKEILAIIKSLPDWEPIGFYDDNKKRGMVVNGLTILGGTEEFMSSGEGMIHAVIAIGDPLVKKRIKEKLNGAKNINFASIIHPSAILLDSNSISIGEGVVIGAGATLTTNISIGAHVLVNINSTIGHDCIIGDFASIMPNANLSGNVTVGSAVLVGSGASIKNSVTLGDESRIGMGAVVLRDVKALDTVVGVPARSSRPF